MTLDERYKIQKKRNEKLKAELDRLKDEFSQAVDAQVDKEVEKAIEDLTALMDATAECYDEFQLIIAEAKKYKEECKSLVAALREMKDEIFKRVPEPQEDDFE